MPPAPTQLPVIDVAPLLARGADPGGVARELDAACRRSGFFYAVGHGVDPELQTELRRQAQAFFALAEAEKREVSMERGGRAWRGYFPLGAEQTSGAADHKEGLYLGEEIAPDDARVRAGTPMFGPNLFPDLPGFRDTVLRYMEELRALGHVLVGGLALALGLERDYFYARYTREPLLLFRIFNYPPLPADANRWSVGQHTDYGLLTILLQDEVGGLEVKTPSGWVPADPLPGAFVCNIGDMLERVTGGAYRSTLHRVRNVSRQPRLSFPFFFDPGLEARIAPIDTHLAVTDDAAGRWDHASVHLFEGTYGDYLLAKVARVFPELGREVL